MKWRFPPELTLVVGIVAVTSSSFIVLAAGEISNSMSDRILLAMYRVFFTATLSYAILYRIFDFNPGISVQNELEGRFQNLSMPLTILISGCSLALHFSLWFISLDYLPVGVSLSLTNSAPIFVVALTWYLYNEKTKPFQVIGIIVAIIGGSILSFESFGDSTIFINGFLFAFLSAVALAIYLSLARKGVLEYGLWNYFGKVNLVAALFLLMWLLILGSSPFSIVGLIYGFLLAVVPGVVGHASFQYAMSRVRSAIVSVSTLGEPLLGTIIAWLFLGQILSPPQIFGGFLILLGVYVASRM